MRLGAAVSVEQNNVTCEARVIKHTQQRWQRVVQPMNGNSKGPVTQTSVGTNLT